MGIRVHKCLGYGLADLEHEDWRLTDPRINSESPLLTYKAPSTEDYAVWLEDNAVDVFSTDRWYLQGRFGARRTSSLEDCVAREGEYGIASALVIRPLCASEWFRFDDTMDWVEETYLASKSQQNRIELLEHGIYPYNSFYMDSRSGERLNSNKAMTWVRAREQVKEGRMAASDLDRVSAELGFRDYEEANRLIAPVVPTEIRDLAAYGELFTSDGVWKQLRPMLYVYWA